MPRFIHEKEPFSLKKTLFEILKQPAYQQALAIPKNIEELGIALPYEVNGIRDVRGDQIIGQQKDVTDDQKLLWLGLWWQLDFSSKQYDKALRRRANQTKAIECWESGAQDGYYCRLALAIEAFNGRYAKPEEGVRLLERAHNVIHDSFCFHRDLCGKEIHRLLGSIYLRGKYGKNPPYKKVADMFAGVYTQSNVDYHSDPIFTGLHDISRALAAPSQWKAMATEPLSKNPKLNLLRGYMAYAAMQESPVNRDLLAKLVPLMAKLEDDFDKSFYAESQADLAAIFALFHAQQLRQVRRWHAKFAPVEAAAS